MNPLSIRKYPVELMVRLLLLFWVNSYQLANSYKDDIKTFLRKIKYTVYYIENGTSGTFVKEGIGQ